MSPYLRDLKSPDISSTVKMKYQGFLHFGQAVYHTQICGVYRQVEPKMRENPKRGTLFGTRFCLQSLVCYTFVPADAKRGDAAIWAALL